MSKSYQFIVIGAGSGGLVLSIGLAKAGKQVLLIEKGLFGGDCTNYGCIPSKALITSSKVAHFIQEAKRWGIEIKDLSLDATPSLERTRNIIEEVRSGEDKEALEKNGVNVLQGTASFLSPYKLLVKTETSLEEVEGKTIIISTGSSPRLPNFENIKEIDYLTNETVFSLTTIPKSMIVLGGGPIGCELAQTFARLGTKVSIIHTHEYLLSKESKNTIDLLEKTFLEEKIDLYLNYHTTSIAKTTEGVILCLKCKNTGEQKTVQSEKILISIGRIPNTSLDLEKAKVDFTEKGITTNAYKRTSQKHIYAIGDCSGPPFFTHLAEHHARGVLQSLLLFSKKIDNQPIPRVTYTNPEIATIGIIEEEATSSMEIYRLSYEHIDRAICEGKTHGQITIITKRWSSKILGATITGERAGEMLMEIATAMHFNIPLRKLNSLIHPYPIYSRGIRKIADMYFTQTLLPKLKNLFKK